MTQIQNNECSVSGCSNARRALGYCWNHYSKNKKYGDPNGSAPSRITKLHTLFWLRADKSGGPDACWLWLGGRGSHGYGQLRVEKRWKQAHRVAWELANGAIPAGLCICHKCDVPLCVNPAHLFAGTHAENMADRDGKGRQVVLRGEQIGVSKLTAQNVSEARQLYAAGGVTHRQLAERYGVCRATIQHVLSGRHWASVGHAVT